MYTKQQILDVALRAQANGQHGDADIITWAAEEVERLSTQVSEHGDRKRQQRPESKAP